MRSPLKHIFFIASVIGLNVLIKNFLQGNTFELGPIKLSLVFNSGFIFGLYNEASHLVRIVLTSVMVGILTLIACYFYEFLHPSLKKLRWGITLGLSGVIGNGLEKLFYGYVWDFINVKLPVLSNFTFNINDLLQIIGLCILVREIFRNQHVIWFPHGETKRKFTIIYKDVQLPILYKVLGMIFIASLTQAILTMALVFPHLKRGSQDVKALFLLAVVFLNMALIPLLGRYLLRELLRCFGPIYALEKFLKNDHSGKELRFRRTDHFHSLEKTVNEFIKKRDKD